MRLHGQVLVIACVGPIHRTVRRVCPVCIVIIRGPFIPPPHDVIDVSILTYQYDLCRYIISCCGCLIVDVVNMNPSRAIPSFQM